MRGSWLVGYKKKTVGSCYYFTIRFYCFLRFTRGKASYLYAPFVSSYSFALSFLLLVPWRVTLKGEEKSCGQMCVCVYGSYVFVCVVPVYVCLFMSARLAWVGTDVLVLLLLIREYFLLSSLHFRHEISKPQLEYSQCQQYSAELKVSAYCKTAVIVIKVNNSFRASLFYCALYDVERKVEASLYTSFSCSINFRQSC